MALNAVQKNSNEDLRRRSLIKSGAIGVVTAYTLKWAIPILPYERDDYFESKLKELDNDILTLEKNEITKVREAASQVKGSDEFIKLYDSKQVSFTDGTKIVGNLTSDAAKIYSNVLTKIKESKAVGIDTLKTMTKKIRPTSAFILSGLGIGLFSAIYHNVYVENVKSNVQSFQTYH